MKAKLINTGEIVDVINYNGFTSDRSISDWVTYIDAKGGTHYRESLNYYLDFEPEEQLDSDLHWKDVKERAAIAAMHAILSCGNGAFRYQGTEDDIARAAIKYADSLIEELKKK